MYTINIKGKPNPKDPSMVKLEMIFFKSNYPRVIKVVNVTGLMSDWDAKSQSFRVGSAEATARTNVSSTLKPNIITKLLLPIMTRHTTTTSCRITSMWSTMVVSSIRRLMLMQIFQSLVTTYHCTILATTISKSIWCVWLSTSSRNSSLRTM